jgi:uncharacterized protein (DUF58 family)
MPKTELLSLKEIHDFDNLELIARQVVEGFIIGLHKSPFHGFSVEFAEHRQYNQGESVRNVDWKVYGRTDRMFVKKFEEETNLRCQIVIDASSSMFYPEDAGAKGYPAVNKIRFSSVAASALMHLLRQQRDSFGLSIFSDKLERNTHTRSTSKHFRLMMQYLHGMMSGPGRKKQTHAAESLHLIAESIHKRSMVIIFSDMFESAASKDATDQKTEELFSALQHLKYNKHEVLLFHVVDKHRELEFQFDNKPYVFVDMETGEKVKLQASQVKDHYIQQVNEYKKEIELKCGQFKIDFIEADINQNFAQIMMPYLLKRSRMY